MANWYCLIQNKQYGPISDEQLQQWIEERRITGNDLIREENQPHWTPLYQATSPQTAPLDALFDSPAPPVQGPGGMTSSTPAAKKSAIAIVLIVLILLGGVIGGYIYLKHSNTLEFTNLETQLSPDLLKDAEGKAIENPYARNIAFPEMKVKFRGDEIRWDVLVQNNGGKQVKFLKVEFSFQDKDGNAIATENDLLAHDLFFGENNSPISPHSTKWAGGDLDNERGWDGEDGKIVARILELKTE